MGGPGPRLSAGAGAEVALAVRAALRGLPDGPVLVALSGGPDSCALLAGALDVADGLGRRVGAVVVDHGWHPRTADVAVRAARAALALGASPVRVVRVVPPRRGSGPGTGGAEESARTARHTALEAAADRDGAAAVLLGHTLDDQAEQVLLGLARGSGTRSLAGMAVRRGRVVRPLLQVRRAAVHEACEALARVLEPLGLPWHDPSNADPAHLRAAVRRRLVPVLEDVLGPGSVEALARTADLARADADSLDAWAGQVVGSVPPLTDGTPVEALEPLPPAVRRRVLRALAVRAGAGALTAAHTDALDALVVDWHGQGVVSLPGGWGIQRVRGADGCGRLRATPTPSPRKDPHGRA